MKALLLNARSYNFTDEKSGRQISGFKVNYVPLEGVAHVDGTLGFPYIVSKGCSSLDQFALLSEKPVPAIYDIGFIQSYDSKGNIIQRPVSFTFVRELLEDFK